LLFGRKRHWRRSTGDFGTVGPFKEKKKKKKEEEEKKEKKEKKKEEEDRKT
jgi:hypothetical protein